MKLIAYNISAFFGILILTSSCANHPSYPGEVKELIDLETQAIQREFKNDTSYLSSIMDSTFIELSNGRIKNKHEVLKTIYNNNIGNSDRNISLDSFLLDEPIVHLYEKAAVVTFILHTFRKKEKTPFERRTRFYDVWVKRGNVWKAATWQASPIEE